MSEVIKSSPFAVKDPEAFLKLIKAIEVPGHLNISRIGDAFVLSGSNFLYGELDVFDEHGDNVLTEDVEMLPLIREHLEENQVVHLMRHSDDGDSHLEGESIILTPLDVYTVDHELMVKEWVEMKGIADKEKIQHVHLNH